MPGTSGRKAAIWSLTASTSMPTSKQSGMRSRAKT
jgi:hypothetical protein